MPELSSGLRLTRAADVYEFERVAGDFLRAREAEHNLILGLCSSLRALPVTPELAPHWAILPPYFAVVSVGDEVVGAAMRTPPLNVILSHMPDDRAVDIIARDMLRESPDLPGVLGEKRPARRFAELWTAETGRPSHVFRAQRIFSLTRVIPPRPASGRLRIADRRDLDVATAWFAAFAREALGEDDPAARRTAEMWLGRAGRTLYLWEDGGAAVSMCGAAGRTPSGIRIGAVYTPPELRGRGYASSCVAAASQAQLDAGLRFCFLFTDLANPTSNKIYQEIGYQAVTDVDEHRFGAPSA